MIELLVLVVLGVLLARLVESRLEKRQNKLDNAFRRHRYTTAAGMYR